MKITFDIDCTPEEARRLMGLPDMAAVHDIYLDKLKKMVDEGVTPDMIQTMMKNWMPMGETGMNVWRTMFDQISGAGGSSKSK